MRPPSQRWMPRAWVLPCLVVLALLAAPLHEAEVAVTRRPREGRPQVLP